MITITGIVHGVRSIGFIPSSRALYNLQRELTVMSKNLWVSPNSRGEFTMTLYDNTELTGKAWWWLVTEVGRGADVQRFVISSEPGAYDYAQIRPIGASL